MMTVIILKENNVIDSNDGAVDGSVHCEVLYIIAVADAFLQTAKKKNY